MKRAERLSRILDRLAEQGRVDVEEIANDLGVSAATVRRDFDALAAQQLLTRTHGGAVSNGTAYDLPMRYRSQRHASDKKRIAEAAAELVHPGMIVGVNGGTTTTEVARTLAARPDLVGGERQALTVVTNALNIANELTVRGHVKIVATGGVARPQSYELIGPLATRTLEGIALDVAFLGVDALDVRDGAAAHHEDEANVNRLLAQRAGQVVVVTDSSKLGRRAFARICSTDEIDLLVTDRDAPVDVVAGLRSAGVDVRLV
ncbi:DeoR/GlpR family DNA-binding transcription regulator [Pseudonocardia nigra]|uniref:DeoR/GlpR family DNA-binding transcription regulator n=1 Tax=Pseudonocardia nigra TaxID=1921578 RepID=UPI001C5E1B15|nr:DeoR/GlpR family DNA-binding transcription regulator [Pseudonocardia nigra]